MALFVGLLSCAALIGDSAYGTTGMKAAVILSAALLIIGASLPTSIIMRLLGAVPVALGPESDLCLLDLRNIVAQLAARAGVEPPRIYLLPSAEANAVTIGRGDDNALVVTRGLVRTVDGKSLEPIIAHEIAHLSNDDANLQRLAAIVGMVSMVLLRLGTVMTFIIVFAAGSAAATKATQLALLSIAAPVAIGLLTSVLLRSRELAADALAAELTTPAALASGLRRLGQSNNFWFRALMATTKPAVPPLRSHPLTAKRIRQLEELQDGWIEPPGLAVEPMSSSSLFSR